MKASSRFVTHFSNIRKMGLNSERNAENLPDFAAPKLWLAALIGLVYKTCAKQKISQACLVVAVTCRSGMPAAMKGRVLLNH